MRSDAACSSAISSRLGAITRHGPHHGAQKSTRTGFSCSSTSAWKLLSVTSVMFAATVAPSVYGYSLYKMKCSRRRLRKPQLKGRHLPDGLDRDPRAHLRVARPSLVEDDRHLADVEPGLQRAVAQLDLEAVAVGVHLLDADCLEDAPVEALEATGQVADRYAQHALCIQAAPAREDAARQAPVGDAAARDVARAQHEVGAVLGL